MVEKSALLAEKSQDTTVKLPFLIERARVLAAAGDLPGAQKLAESAVEQTHQLGFVRYEFEARVLLGTIQLRGKNPAAARSNLIGLEKAAHKKGFELIARDAAALR